MLSFERARMKLLVKRKSCIPTQVVGKSLGVQFNISVSVEEPMYPDSSPTQEYREAVQEEFTTRGPTVTIRIPNSGEVISLGTSLGAGLQQEDFSLTLIMAPMARSWEQVMGGISLPTEDFLQICMATGVHGEVKFPPEWQIMPADSNSNGPAANQLKDGPREESIGFSFFVDSLGLGDKLLKEPREAPLEGECFESADLYDSHSSLNEHCPLSLSFSLSRNRASSTSMQGPLVAKNSTMATEAAGMHEPQPNSELEELLVRNLRKTSRRKQCDHSGKTGNSPDPPAGRKKARKIQRPVTTGVARKRRPTPRRTTRGRNEDQSMGEDAIAGESISDNDIQHQNKILQEVNVTWE